MLSEQMMTYYLKEMRLVVPVEMYLMAKQQSWALHSCQRAPVILAILFTRGFKQEKIWVHLIGFNFWSFISVTKLVLFQPKETQLYSNFG